MPEAPLEITIPAEAAGERLDRALVAALAPTHPEISRTRVKALIDAGAVRRDGKAVHGPAQRVRAGDVFAVAMPPTAPSALAAQAMALDILYEDDQLIVVDKPAGLVVHPGPGNPDRTLVNALIAHCGASLV